MGLKLIFRYNFYSDLFELNKVPSIYKSIAIKLNSNTIPQEYFKVYDVSEENINSFKLVPNYLKIEKKECFIIKKVFEKYGYAANLTECKSIDDYIKINFKSSFRNNVKRSIKRVESSFNIQYKMFYGDISFETYTGLMSDFYTMLSKRFKQRNIKNITLENWEHYLKISFNRINKKEASLFVMFQEEKPIAFSLNFHFENVFYFAIPTFNLDYSKFSLGNVVIYKNLEWCLINKFNMFDMGYGGFENKINWCNTRYSFENHIVFKSENSLGNLYSVILKYKYQLTNFLIAKNVNGLVKNFINSALRKNSFKPLRFKITDLDNSFNIKENSTLQIDYNNTTYAFLNKPIFDFLYTHNENIKNILVYKFENKKNTYLVSVANSQIKIEIFK